MVDLAFRSEAKARNAPSGDHTGTQSFAGLKVKRVILPVVTSINQMSRFPVSVSGITNATRFPSGESLGSPYSPGDPTLPRRRPERSYHESNLMEGMAR